MSFPFDSTRGAILVRGQISGPTGSVNVRLLLDTGATNSLINTDRILAIGFQPDHAIGSATMAMGNGIGVAPRFVLTRFTALGQHRFGFPVLSHQLPPEAGVDGLLGLDFFRGLSVTLDFRSGLIIIN